ncbi:MAG: hypothetical protein ACP5NV_01405 [Candidatus Woesearchaeota archaeon]
MTLTQTIKDIWNEHKLKKNMKKRGYTLKHSDTIRKYDISRMLLSLPVNHEVKRISGSVRDIQENGEIFNPRNLFDNDYYKLDNSDKKRLTFIKDDIETNIVSIKKKHDFETTYIFEINPSTIKKNQTLFWDNDKFRTLYEDFTFLYNKVFQKENDSNRIKEINILNLKIERSDLDLAIEQLEKDLSNKIYKNKDLGNLSVKCLYEGTLEILKSVKDNPDSKPELMPKMKYLKNMIEVVNFVDKEIKHKEFKNYTIREIGELIEVSKEPFMKTFSRLKNINRKTGLDYLEHYATFCKNALRKGWDLDEIDKIIYNYHKISGDVYWFLTESKESLKRIEDINEFKTFYKQSNRLLKKYLENGGTGIRYYSRESLFPALLNESPDKREEYLKYAIGILKYAKKELSKEYNFMGKKYKHKFESFFENCVNKAYLRGE